MVPRSTGLLGLLVVAAALLGASPAAAQIPEQCKNTTTSYDISFIGPLRTIKAGTITYGYHRFGPLRPGLKANATLLPPLIMLSGFGAYMYVHPIPILQQSAYDRVVFIFDHMRVGASTNDTDPKANLTIPLMAGNTVLFIKALKLARLPDLYGWSLGGAIVTTMAALHGDSFRHGVIINGYAGGNESWVMPARNVDSLLAIRDNYTEYLSFLFPKGTQDRGACSLFATWNSFYNSKYAKLAEPISDEVLKEQYAANERFFRDNRVVEALPKSTNRLLVFSGTQDKMVPVRNGEVIANPVPGSWQLRFANEGHGLPFSSPRGVIYLMAEFWNFAEKLSEADIEFMSYGVHPSELPAAAAAAPAPAKAPAPTKAPAPAKAPAASPAAPKAQGPAAAAAAPAPGPKASPKPAPFYRPGAQKP